MKKKKLFVEDKILKYNSIEEIPGILVWEKKNANHQDILLDIVKLYNKPGVWAMFGLKGNE